jgi:protein SCO1
MTSLRARWLLFVAAACAAVAGFWLAHQLDRASPQLASGTWLPEAKRVLDFQLIDATGRPFARGALAGAPTLVYFGFTHCPDVCPTTLLKLAQVKKQAGMAKLRVVFISIDPARDTPPLVGTYAHAFDPQFQGVTGDAQNIARVAANFGVAVARVDLPGGDYTMDHSSVVFLLNDAGNIAAVFTPPFEVAPFVQDLKRAAPYLGSGRAST